MTTNAPAPTQPASWPEYLQKANVRNIPHARINLRARQYLALIRSSWSTRRFEPRNPVLQALENTFVADGINLH